MKKLLLITLAMFAAFMANAEEVKVTWNGQSDWTGVADQAATISYTYNGIAITVDKAEQNLQSTPTQTTFAPMPKTRFASPVR